MKKIISLLLVVFMLVPMLAACGSIFTPATTETQAPAQTQTPATTATVESAVKYLQAMYQNDNETTSPKDYTLVGIVNIENTTFTVTWTSDTAAVQIIPAADGKTVTVDVNEESPEVVTYTLTATVTAPNGTTATYSIKRTVPVGIAITIEEAMALEDGSDVTLMGTVVSIVSAWSDQYKNISVMLKDAAGKEIQLYRLATKVEVGDVITVKGKITSYNDKKQIDAGATATITGKEEVKINYTEMTIEEALAAKEGTDVIIKGYVSLIDTPWSEDYKNISVKLKDDSGKEILLYRLATKVEVGDKLTVKGKIGVHNEVNQIAAGAIAEITGKVEVTITYTEMTIEQALAGTVGTPVEIKGYVSYVQTAWNDEYTTVKLKDEAGKEILLYKLGTEVALGDELTVKGLIDNYNDVNQIKSGTAEVTGHRDIVVEFAEMTVAEAIAAADGTGVEITGVVTEITYKWSDKDKNMSVVLADGTGEIALYKLGTQVALGDKIVVKGNVSTYKVKQIGEGATAEVKGNHVEATVTEAIAKEDNTLVAVTGSVTKINYNWNDTNKNMSVTISDGTNTLYIFKLATQVAEGDKITVYGKVSTYNNAKQIAAGAFAIILPPEADATLDFSVEANRVSHSTTQHKWSANGIEFINDKNESSNNVVDNIGPIRCYASSSITVNYTGIKTIVFYCNKDSYATDLSAMTVEGATVTVDGKVVTYTFETAVNTFSIAKLAKQVRLDSIAIYK